MEKHSVSVVLMASPKKTSWEKLKRVYRGAVCAVKMGLPGCERILVQAPDAISISGTDIVRVRSAPRNIAAVVQPAGAT
jgi:hypothetical protein